MKLESLKSSIFGAFKEDVLENPMAVIGGEGRVTKTKNTNLDGSDERGDRFFQGDLMGQANSTSTTLTNLGGGDLVLDLSTGGSGGNDGHQWGNSDRAVAFSGGRQATGTISGNAGGGRFARMVATEVYDIVYRG